MDWTSTASAFRSTKGVALITSLAIMAVVGVLILGAVMTTQIELAVSRNDATSAQAQYIAQAGLQTYKAALFQNFRWLERGGATGGPSGSTTPNTDACENSLSGGLNFERMSSGGLSWVNNRIQLPQESVTDVDGTVIGSYSITFMRDPNNPSRITIQSVGQTGGGSDNFRATATATATFVIRNSTTLEQAIFAGSGSGMRFVNGNTTIYGGIYIVGDPSNADAQVIEANGNMSILNGYSASQSGRPQAVVSSAHSAANLCAALRVESGKVAIGGSTLLGEKDNRLLTVAVSRGIEDIDTSKGGTLECQGNKGVCSEAGVKPFDIGEPPIYPKLDASPNTPFCPEPKTWRTCIREEASADGMILTTNGGNTVTLESPSGATLSPACQSHLEAAARSTSKVLTLDSTIDCTVTIDGVRSGFKYTPGHFEVYGNVNLRGINLRFNRDVEYHAVSRNEEGASQPFANLSLEAIGGVGGNFLTEKNFTAGSSSDSVRFPNNVLSIIAEGTVELVGGNNTYYTVPVYAGTEFRLGANSKLFGQVIADVFCTTNKAGECKQAGSPAEIFFVPTGENRSKSFRAIAPSSLPTFTVEAYELR